MYSSGRAALAPANFFRALNFNVSDFFNNKEAAICVGAIKKLQRCSKSASLFIFYNSFYTSKAVNGLFFIASYFFIA